MTTSDQYYDVKLNETTPTKGNHVPNTPTVFPETNGKAVASMVLGILSLVFSCLGICLGPIAICLGVQAKRIIRDNPTRYTGLGFATAGVIMGTIAVVLSVIGIIFAIVYVALVLSGNIEDESFASFFNATASGDPYV